MTQQDINDFRHKVNHTLEWWNTDKGTKDAVRQLMDAVLELAQKTENR